MLEFQFQFHFPWHQTCQRVYLFCFFVQFVPKFHLVKDFFLPLQNLPLELFMFVYSSCLLVLFHVYFFFNVYICVFSLCLFFFVFCLFMFVFLTSLFLWIWSSFFLNFFHFFWREKSTLSSHTMLSIPKFIFLKIKSETNNNKKKKVIFFFFFFLSFFLKFQVTFFNNKQIIINNKR